MTSIAPKDACELLDADHIAVKHLFVQYSRLAVEPDRLSTEDERTVLAQQICNGLTIHAQLEEEIFYPALQNAVPAAESQLREAYAEHGAAKQLIADIQAIGRADPAMDTLVSELNGEIEHHVKEERGTLFPKAKAAAGLDLLALGGQLAARQQELKSQTRVPPR